MSTGRLLVVGDIHGAAKALKQVLQRCRFDYELDTLITLGDICDGWSHVYDVVEELLQIKNRIDIKGNHDDWFTTWLRTGLHPTNWTQGGGGTYISYKDAANMTSKQLLNPGDIPETHIEFFMNQLYYYQTDTKHGDTLFVHGGIDPVLPMHYQNIHEMMWDRDLWNEAQLCKDNEIIETRDNFKRIYIGHTHIDDWRNPLALPQQSGGVYNLDTGAGWSGKLTIMDANSGSYWQSDFVKELYPKERGR